MVYEYKCPACGNVLDLEFPMGKAPDAVAGSCPEHGRVLMVRKFSGVSFRVTEGTGAQRQFVDRAKAIERDRKRRGEKVDPILSTRGL